MIEVKYECSKCGVPSTEEFYEQPCGGCDGVIQKFARTTDIRLSTTDNMIDLVKIRRKSTYVFIVEKPVIEGFLKKNIEYEIIGVYSNFDKAVATIEAEPDNELFGIWYSEAPYMGEPYRFAKNLKSSEDNISYNIMRREVE
jgi:outer membrane PBP1 activator LpoA protein